MSKLAGTGVLLLALFLAGCATGGEERSGGTGAVTGDQLVETGQTDLLEALRILRPQWLRARSSARLTGERPEVTVFVNETPFGTVGVLSSIPLAAVEEVRYMSASDATTRYGMSGGAAGLILVRTRG